ncbi:Clavaminate synthase-like protein [Violaceomyces palustris]|uniref:Clavaminate synthase-like protein n=1 Tax=Violaceomyces palustris TaxID=1673888 RepID=A0ACD0NUN2_9BASI|nr:Clavaminate synthase-like protein [Violaceomyces palustris]
MAAAQVLERTKAVPTKLEIDLAIDEEAIRNRLFGTPYEPNPELWKADQNKFSRLSEEERNNLYETFKGSGYPERAQGPTIWDGKVLIDQTEKWLYQVSEEERVEVEEAVKHFVSLDLGFDSISKETFPLKSLSKQLEKAKDEIHDGIGFTVIRGLKPEVWNREERIIAFAGIASYVGPVRLKQQDGQAIVHLRDLTRLKSEQRPTITLKGQTNGNQVAHTDAGDIVGLFTLGKAERGGLSQLSSVGQVYNWLAENRPDVLSTLIEPSWEWSGQEATPLFHHHKGRILAQYARRPWFGFYEDQNRRGDSPELSYEKHVALDAIHFVAEKFFLDIDLQPGDLEFFNNLQVFHARTYSEDSEENVRHLLRIWVRDEERAIEIPKVLEKRWKALLENESLRWPVEPWDK